MSSFSADWCRTFWNAMRFMQAVWDAIEESDVVSTTGSGWWVGKVEEGDDPDARLYIDCGLKAAKGKMAFLTIYFAIDRDGPFNGYPIWICLERKDPSLYLRLLKAFLDVPHHQDDSEMQIGLPLDIPAEATEQEIEEMGRRFAEKIISALVPEESQ